LFWARRSEAPAGWAAESAAGVFPFWATAIVARTPAPRRIAIPVDLTVWKIMAWMTPRAKAAMDTGTAAAPTSKPLTDDHRDASCMVDSTREAGRDGTLRRAGSVNRATTGARIPRPGFRGSGDTILISAAFPWDQASAV